MWVARATATGTGFAASQTITFTLNGVAATSTCSSDPNGSFSCTVTNPGGAARHTYDGRVGRGEQCARDVHCRRVPITEPDERDGREHDDGHGLGVRCFSNGHVHAGRGGGGLYLLIGPDG